MFAPQRVVVVGAGYVGLTTAACLAHLGHRVVCADISTSRVRRLRRGAVDVLEPALPELVAEGLGAGVLTFEVGAGAGLATVRPGPTVVFACVPTPSGPDGTCDLAPLASVLDEIAGALVPGDVFVVKSTVPVGTTREVRAALSGSGVEVACNPEFLRESSAVADFLAPDRIVIGVDDPNIAARVADLYAPLESDVVRTDPASAELAKYIANCFLAVKLSYANDVAALCERVGADARDVLGIAGRDPRIGPEFLRPGPGWGGSCLPKDTRALLRSAAAAGQELPLVRAAAEINAAQQDRIAHRIFAAAGAGTGRPRIALLGLAFKPGTNDLRESPAVAVGERLAVLGAQVVAHDPAVRAAETRLPFCALHDQVEHAVSNASVVAVLTGWPEFADLDWPRLAGLMAGVDVVDTCGVLDPQVLAAAGLRRHGLGSAQPRFAAGMEPPRRDTA